MNIGIIVYSRSGNTESVARKLQERLSAAGRTVSVERITVTGDISPGSKNFQFETLPAVDRYKTVVFGAPVHAFALAPVMAAYLKQLSSLSGKKVACFVTKQLPFNWTGGNRAIAQMEKICESKGSEVCGSGIVIWEKSRRQQSINECLKKLEKHISDFDRK